MSVTQKQLARELGISQTLVCRALTGNGYVSEENRQLILATAQRLGYDAGSNQAARQLVARRHGGAPSSHRIAVLAPRELALPFSGLLLEGVEDTAKELGLEVAYCPLQEDDLPSLVTGGNVDGVITLTNDSQVLAQLNRLGIATVTLMVRTERAHNLLPDERAGIRMATEHLVDLGHTKIAYVGLEAKRSNGFERLQGYLEGLENCGLHPAEALIHADLPGVSPAAGALAFEKLSQKHARHAFTAVVCYNDWTAIGLICQAEKMGMKVPADLSVTGFDANSHEFHFRPAITSVGYSRWEMGQAAVQMLRLRDEGAVLPRQKLFPVHVEPGGSTCALVAAE